MPLRDSRSKQRTLLLIVSLFWPWPIHAGAGARDVSTPVKSVRLGNLTGVQGAGSRAIPIAWEDGVPAEQVKIRSNGKLAPAEDISVGLQFVNLRPLTPAAEEIIPGPSLLQIDRKGATIRRLNGHGRNGAAHDLGNAVLADVLNDKVRAHPQTGDANEELAAGRDLFDGEALKQWGQSHDRLTVWAESLSHPRFVRKSVVAIETYEMRTLSRILQAADNGERFLFLTSKPVNPLLINHLLDRLSPQRRAHVLSNVLFVSLGDKGSEILAAKLIHPRNEESVAQLRRIIAAAGLPAVLHTYMSTPLEAEAARKLGIPHFGYNPSVLADWAGKIGGHQILKEAGLPVADMAVARSEEGIVQAAAALRKRNLGLTRIWVKISNGTSGAGNAWITLPKRTRPGEAGLEQIRVAVRSMALPDNIGYNDFIAAVEENGSVVEANLGDDRDPSPSGQGLIQPNGTVEILSTHKQRLGLQGSYVGLVFPADERHRAEIDGWTRKVGENLAARGFHGYFGVDYKAVRDPRTGKRVLHGIEINVRALGTTNPYLTAKHLTRASYDAAKGLLVRPDGTPVYYAAKDHEIRTSLKGIALKDFLEFFNRSDILFDPATGNGVVFHVLEGVPLKGNIGYTVIGAGREEVRRIERRLQRLFDRLEIEYARKLADDRQSADTLRQRQQPEIAGIPRNGFPVSPAIQETAPLGLLGGN